MSFREQINEYINKSAIPEAMLPQRLGDYIKPELPEKPAPAVQKNEKKIVDAETFIRFVQSQKLTGDEFLQVLGNSRINNSAYIEIQENPQLTCSRLIEILDDSALSSEDYEKLIISIYKRNKLKEDALAKIEARTNTKTVELPKPEPAEEDNLRIGQESLPPENDSDNEESDEDEESGEDADELYEVDPNSVYGRMSEKKEFYKGNAFFDDEDTYEPGINRGKTIAAAVLAVFLIAGSFGIRYLNTGSFLVAGNSAATEEKLETYEDIYAAVSVLSADGSPAEKSSPLYSVNGETADDPVISRVAVCGDYMLVCNENEMQIIQSIGSRLKLIDTIVYTDTLLGLTVCDNRIVVISQCEMSTPFSYNYILENDDGTTQSIPSNDTLLKKYICFRILDSENPSAVTSTIMQSGELVDLIKTDSAIYIITSDSAAKNAVNSVQQTYLPHILTDNVFFYPSVEDVFIPANAEYDGYVAFGTLNFGESVTSSLTVCAGGSGQQIVTEDASVYVMQNSGKNTALVKYAIQPDKISYVGVTGLEGNTGNACGLNTGDGNIRVTTVSDGGVNLIILDPEMNVLSEMKQIGTNEPAVSTCFDTINAYVVTKTDTGNNIYGVNTLYPNDLTTLSAVTAKISSAKLHRWNDSLSLSLTASADESGNRTGLTLTMYDVTNDFKELSSIGITAETSVSGDWNRYLSSPAENNANAIYGNEKSGIIIIPIKYFDGISEIEKFLVYDYSDENGLSLRGSVVAYDLRSDIMLAAIGENKFFAVWDNRVICADSANCSVLNTLEIK